MSNLSGTIVRGIKSADSKRLIRNMGSLLIGNVGALALSLITTAYLARVLGQTEFGKFSYGQTIALYGALLVDMGLTTYGNRAVATSPDRAIRYLFNIGTLQVLWCVVLLAGIAFVTGIFQIWTDNDLQTVVIVSLLWMLPFALNIEWFFLGSQRMAIVGASKVIQYGFGLLFTYILVKNSQHTALAPFARVAGGMISAVWLFSRLPRNAWRTIHVDLREALKHLRSSKWFWASAVLIQVYSGVDIIILKIYRPINEVGIYSASFRLIGFLVLAISLVNTAIFPMLASSKKQGKNAFSRLMDLYFLLAVAIAIGLLVGGILFADQLIMLVYGVEYSAAVLLFRILIVAAAALVLNGAIAQPLLAAGYESKVTQQVFVTAFVYVLLNAVLIPMEGAYGAAWVYVITVFFGTGWLIPIYWRKLRLNDPTVR